MPDDSLWEENRETRMPKVDGLPIIKTVEDVEPALERVAVKGRCGMYAPAGTKCKVCGKVHPL